VLLPYDLSFEPASDHSPLHELTADCDVQLLKRIKTAHAAVTCQDCWRHNNLRLETREHDLSLVLVTAYSNRVGVLNREDCVFFVQELGQKLQL